MDKFIAAVSGGEIHPLDKFAVADGLSEVLEHVSEHLSKKSDLIDSINEITEFIEQ